MSVALHPPSLLAFSCCDCAGLLAPPPPKSPTPSWDVASFVVAVAGVTGSVIWYMVRVNMLRVAWALRGSSLVIFDVYVGGIGLCTIPL